MPPVLPVVDEYRLHRLKCPRCRFKSTAVIRHGARVVRGFLHGPLPIGIERGRLVGRRLTTLIAYFKGVCHASFSTIRKFLRDVVHVTISSRTAFSASGPKELAGIVP